MDDAMKKFLDEADRMKKLAAGFDIEKQLGLSSAAAEAMKSISAFNPVPKMHFPEVEIYEPPIMPKITTFEETNHFQSAGVLLRRLADSIAQWRAQLPEDVQPAVLAMLHGGVQIDVETLAQESFHGIRIEGKLQGSQCVVLAHQATVQLLCFIQPVNPPEHPRRPIGFVVDGKAWEA